MSDTNRLPITEADLHAYVDGRLPEARRRQVEAYLRTRPEELARVNAWASDSAALRRMLAPVLDEPIPIALCVRPPRALPWRQLAAAASIAVVSATAGWLVRGALSDDAARAKLAVAAPRDAAAAFAQRAAVAHVVYSPEVRRPVEVGVDQEEQLVAWLSKRLGAQLTPPRLGHLGSELIGGGLLPGSRGPVAQFMYHDADGQRLTLYVTREAAGEGNPAFRYAQEGPVNVFYWVDGRFGYAISAGADRKELDTIAREVYRQLRMKS